MPRFPNFANRASLITGSVFEKYRAKMTAQGENLIKLHIGDTYLPPSYPLPVTKELVTDHPDFNRYCNTFGIAALRDALAVKLQEDNDLAVNRDQILITNGATNALSISMMALVAPGDEVLVLSPAWPFFFGMVRIAGGEILDVPFYTRLFDEPDLDIGNYLSQFVTSSTVALYLNTPNNPSGKVLSREQIEKVADFVREHDLWVVSDEAYDGLTFDGLAHISIATLPEMFDRTLSVFTFSKSFMFAGLRLGYVVAGEEALANLNKMMVHQLYSPSTLAQQMMVEPVKTRREWLPAVRAHYQELRDLVVENLAADCPKPEAGYFVFFPVEKYLHSRSYRALIEACLDHGVSVAPGDMFGDHYQNYIRLCFTGEPEGRLRTGLERLNEILR